MVENMQKYCIYKVTNLVNGKLYIGKTNNFEKRKLEHTRYDVNNDNIFHKTLRKYGLDKFDWEIIDEAYGLDAINDLERYYIQKYKTYKPYGYNMTKGGDGGSMWNARPVVCLTLEGVFVKRYDSAGETKSDGFSDSSVLECCKGILSQTKKHIFMFEDDYRLKGARKYEVPVSTSRKRIVQCDMKGKYIKEYESIIKASSATQIARTRISSALTGASKTAGGYIFVYERDYPIKDVQKYQPRKKGTKIAMIDKESKQIIRCFDRIADAGKALGVNYKAIHKVLDKEERSAYGYVWKRIEG